MALGELRSVDCVECLDLEFTWYLPPIGMHPYHRHNFKQMEDINYLSIMNTDVLTRDEVLCT
jgi:hypothetical protein